MGIVIIEHESGRDDEFVVFNDHGIALDTILNELFPVNRSSERSSNDRKNLIQRFLSKESHKPIMLLIFEYLSEDF